MATELEYALMAGGAYFSTRAPINQFPIPAGWTQLGTSLDYSSGFEAVAFQQQGTNDIVISYAGTYPGLADVTADGLLGAGMNNRGQTTFSRQTHSILARHA
jgi:hypothetical protein